MKGKYISGICGAIAVGSLFGGECKPREDIECIVVKEGGTIVDRQQSIEKSNGALFGNESVKFGKLTYCIQVESTDKKIYTLGIICSSGSYGRFEEKLEAMALAIEPGTKLRISNFSADDNSFLQSIDTVYDDNIQILEKSGTAKN